MMLIEKYLEKSYYTPYKENEDIVGGHKNFKLNGRYLILLS